MHRFLQRAIADEVGISAQLLRHDLGLSHERGAFGDLFHPADQVPHFLEIASPHEVTDDGLGLNDIGRDAPPSTSA